MDLTKVGIAATLGRGAASAWAATMVAVACTFWLAPFAITRLGSEQYSVFILASDALLWLSFLDMGLTGVLSVRLAHFGSEESPERDRIASTGFLAQTAVAAATLLAGLLIAFISPQIFALPNQYAKETQKVFYLLSAATSIAAAAKTYNAILIANRKLHLSNLNNIWGVLLRTAAIATCLQLGFGLSSMAYGTIVATIFTTFQARLLVNRELPLIRLSFGMADRKILLDLWRTGLWVALNGAAIIALRTVDRFGVSHFVALAAVTPYTLTGRLYEVAQSNLAQIATPAAPQMAETLGRGHRLAAKRLWGGIAQTLIVLGSICCWSLWSINQTFLNSWVGSDKYGGIYLDTLLGANVVASLAVISFRIVLTSAQIVKPQALWRLTEAGTFLICSFLSVRHGGLAAVAATKLICTILCSLWMPYTVANLLGSTPGSIANDFCSMLLRSTIAVAPFAILGRLATDKFPTFPAAVVIMPIVASLSLIACLRWAIQRDDNRYISLRLARIPLIGKLANWAIGSARQLP